MDEQQDESGHPQQLHYHRRRTDDGRQGDMRQHEESQAHSQHHNGNEDDGQHDSRKKESSDKDNKDEDDKDGKDDDAKKKMSPKKKRLLIIIAVIVGIILIIAAIAYWMHARHFETTDDAFIDGNVSQVSARVSGQILSLEIVDNQRVKQGQLIAEIDPSDYQVKLAQAQAERAQAVAQLAMQKANYSQAHANIGIAEAEDFQARRDLARYRKVNPRAVSNQQVDTAVANAHSAASKLRANREAADAAKANIQAAQATIQQADVAIQNAQLQLSYTEIRAPIDGRITRRTVDVGNVVSVGLPLLAVTSDDLWVTANYKETQLTHMHAGQHVQIVVDAFPDVTFSGHVDSFQQGTGSVFSTLPAENATGNYVKVVQRIPVKILFDNLDERNKYPLSQGMSVDPRVTVQ